MEHENTSFWTDIKKYEDTLANDPSSHCFAPLAELYRKVGMLDDAVDVAEKGIALHPDYVSGLMVLGSAYSDKGMLSQARVALERVLRFTPENVQVMKQLSSIYLESGETLLAFNILESVLSDNPDDTESRIMLESLERTACRSKESEMINEPEDEEYLPDAAEPLNSPLMLDDEDLFEIELVDELDELEDEVVELPPSSDKDYKVTVEESSSLSVVQGSPESLGIMTVTLAELYVSQGHLDKAVGIYRNLLSDEPLNGKYRSRLEQLELEIASSGESEPEEPLLDPWVDEEAQSDPGFQVEAERDLPQIIIRSDLDSCCGMEAVVETLQKTLENIRRVRECRSEKN